jgi:uncharacterized protein
LQANPNYHSTIGRIEEMNEESVSFRSGQLMLEGVKSTPVGAGPFPAVVVCHPHPSFGGSMDNNVVMSICEALFEKSIVTLRFNFRGVGKSEGSFGHGIGEQEDVQAAISFLARRKRSIALGLAGYSAGAVFGVPVAVTNTRVLAFAAISLPIGMMDLEAVRTSPKPKLFVSGSRDDFASVDDLNEFCRSCVEPKECVIVEGADHFWQGHEADLAATVSDFFSRTLNPSD